MESLHNLHHNPEPPEDLPPDFPIIRPADSSKRLNKRYCCFKLDATAGSLTGAHAFKISDEELLQKIAQHIEIWAGQGSIHKLLIGSKVLNQKFSKYLIMRHVKAFNNKNLNLLETEIRFPSAGVTVQMTALEPIYSAATCSSSFRQHFDDPICYSYENKEIVIGDFSSPKKRDNAPKDKMEIENNPFMDPEFDQDEVNPEGYQKVKKKTNKLEKTIEEYESQIGDLVADNTLKAKEVKKLKKVNSQAHSDLEKQKDQVETDIAKMNKDHDNIVAKLQKKIDTYQKKQVIYKKKFTNLLEKGKGIVTDCTKALEELDREDE